MLRGKISLSKPEVKKIGWCEALFYLKNLKFTCLETFLSLLILGSSVKTTNVLELGSSFCTFADRSAGMVPVLSLKTLTKVQWSLFNRKELGLKTYKCY